MILVVCYTLLISPSSNLASPAVVQVNPLVPDKERLVGAVGKPMSTTLPAKPVAIPINTNVRLTAELTKPSQNQISVAVLPQAPQGASSTPNNGVPSYSGPPLVLAYGSPSSVGMACCLIVC